MKLFEMSLAFTSFAAAIAGLIGLTGLMIHTCDRRQQKRRQREANQ